MEKNKRGSDQSGSFGKRKTRQRPSTGLEIEAGFEVWLAFLRQHLGSSYAWDRAFKSDLEQVNAIDAETALLLKIAPEWSATYEVQTCIGDPNLPANWTYRGSFTGGKAELDGFTPGTVIWGRVRKIGTGGEVGDWSDPAQIRAS